MAYITPIDLFAKFHGEEVREQDLENLLNRAVRREVVKNCLEIFNIEDAEEKESRKESLIDSLDTFPISFTIACKEANIFPPKDLTFDIAANLIFLAKAIERIGENQLNDKLFQFTCKATQAEDELWIEMGLAFIDHDDEKGTRILIEKDEEIRALVDECKGFWKEVPGNWKEIIRQRMDNLVDSYEFFTSV